MYRDLTYPGALAPLPAKFVEVDKNYKFRPPPDLSRNSAMEYVCMSFFRGASFKEINPKTVDRCRAIILVVVARTTTTTTDIH